MFNRMQTITLEAPVWPDDTECGVMQALVDDAVRKAFKAPRVTETFRLVCYFSLSAQRNEPMP